MEIKPAFESKNEKAAPLKPLEGARPGLDLAAQSAADLAAKEKQAKKGTIESGTPMKGDELVLRPPPSPAAEAPAEQDPEQGRLFQRRAGYGKPLSDITVRLAVREAETGQLVEIPEKADVALREVDGQITTMRRLLECLRS
jgi:hypothetical protein